MSKPPIFVVYKKPRAKKLRIARFDGYGIDEIIDGNKRKPPLPHDYEIVDIGIGGSFYERFKAKYFGKKKN